MNKQNKICKTVLLAAVIWAAGAGSLYAQSTESTQSTTVAGTEHTGNLCRNEFSMWAAGGWSPLYYSPLAGERDNLPLGGNFGFGYTFYFTQHFGLHTGAELAYYQNRWNSFGMYDNYNTPDNSPYTAQEGVQNINFRYRMDNYTETQRMWAVNIPLMLQLQTNRQGSHGLFFALGGKLGIPVSSRYSGSHGTLTSMGYYYDYNQVDDEETTQLGYGRFDNISSNGKLDVKLAFSGTAEMGVKWYLGKNINLYTGVYGEYGFNDILKNPRNSRFAEANSYVPEAGTFRVNSVLHSQYNNGIADLEEASNASNEGITRPIASRLSPAAFGVKVRISFGMGCKSAPEDNLKEMQQLQQAVANAQSPCPEEEFQANKPIANGRPLYNDPALMQEIEDYLAKRDKGRKQYIEEGDDLGEVHYNVNIVTLTAEQRRTLDGYIELLWEQPEMNIYITGHACDLGSNEYNMWIGQERADLAKEYMVRRGIRPSRIATDSKGETEPIVPNTSDANRKTNRRLEIVTTMADLQPQNNIQPAKPATGNNSK